MTKKIIITHSGDFHADDCFAVATLSILLKNQNQDFEILRTRKREEVEKGDFVVDVGGVYDPEKNLFDHHQQGGARTRKRDIPYAAFGLVFRKFGGEICGSENIAEEIENKLVIPIDAHDNGVPLSETGRFNFQPYLIQDVIFAMRPTRDELENGKRDHDKGFFEAVSFAENIIQREIVRAKNRFTDASVVNNIYEKAEDKRIIILPENYEWQEVLSDKSEPRFVVEPASEGGRWEVNAVRTSPFSFECRAYFPTSWAGKRDEELAEVSGIKDAVFCHNARFVAVAGSKESAIKMADSALAGS